MKKIILECRKGEVLGEWICVLITMAGYAVNRLGPSILEITRKTAGVSLEDLFDFQYIRELETLGIKVKVE